jgi:hypothetical protein
MIMTPWRTYQSGHPRHSEAFERLARHRAAKLGYRLHRSRKYRGPSNAGRFILVHRVSSTVVLGAEYTASTETILEFIERETRMKKANLSRVR